MGRKLFGIDIAKEVARGIASAGGVVLMTLVKVTPGTRTTGALTGGTNPTETSYTCRGFLEPGAGTDSGAATTDRAGKLSILGGTLPSGVVPAVNDRAVFEGVTYQINTVKSDPADAVYECKVAP